MVSRVGEQQKVQRDFLEAGVSGRALWQLRQAIAYEPYTGLHPFCRDRLAELDHQSSRHWNIEGACGFAGKELH
jgi:hypothetical protein